jgi:hypothetical protein
MGAQKVDVLNKSLHARMAYSHPAIMSTATWEHWLIRRYLLETETPGRFGYFTAADGA